MLFSSILIPSLLAITTLATPLTSPDDHDNDGGLRRICPGLRTQDNGCIRYTRGFDVTGVVTEVDLTFPKVRTECDCIRACVSRSASCANYVYKFSTPESVKSGYRTCTLYSDFNLPAGVTIEFDLASANNVDINATAIIAHMNNPHAGGLVPQAFKDKNLDTIPDPDAVSGPVWTLANGQIQC